VERLAAVRRREGLPRADRGEVTTDLFDLGTERRPPPAGGPQRRIAQEMDEPESIQRQRPERAPAPVLAG
jgi:hypothetical protein